MNELKNLRVGFALTGSFCTFSRIFKQIEGLIKEGVDILPIMSETSSNTNTRFGEAENFITRFENLTAKKVIRTINDAEPIGPQKLLDALIIAPCTGNTISKIANGITDTCVSLAAKAHMRNSRPLVIAVSTNDGLGMNAKNIGLLINSKNIYMVPFEQDDYVNKPNSLVSKMDFIMPTLVSALSGKQIQPVISG